MQLKFGARSNEFKYLNMVPCWKALQDSITKLSSIRKLSICDCKELESLPTCEESHPSNTEYI